MCRLEELYGGELYPDEKITGHGPEYEEIRENLDKIWEELKRLLGEGYSIRDCAEEMGKSKSSVHRLKRKLEGLA